MPLKQDQFRKGIKKPQSVKSSFVALRIAVGVLITPLLMATSYCLNAGFVLSACLYLFVAAILVFGEAMYEKSQS